jgi:hypothetical protein
MARRKSTDLQLEILDRLSQGMKRRDIAAELGCNVQTVDRVKANPELREEFYRQCVSELESHIPAAIKALIDIVNSPTAQDSAKVGAARELLNRTRLHEMSTVKTEPIKVEISYE